MYIPYSVDLRLMIINEFHKKPYSGYPRYQKMVTSIRKQCYWPKMKREATDFIAR